MVNWAEQTDVPLMISHRRLINRKTIRPALGPIVIDSGGFSELSMYGRWKTSENRYIDDISRYCENLKTVHWASPMDWMCEPVVLEATGLSVKEHQYRTVKNFCRLREKAPELPFIPVLQGWTHDDYFNCISLYESAGIDLEKEKIVGVGSVCRRQDTKAAHKLFSDLACEGIQCHGFGIKIIGLTKYSQYLASADSLAWSYNARRNPPLSTCTHQHCSNCLKWALRWRERVLLYSSVKPKKQLRRISVQ